MAVIGHQLYLIEYHKTANKSYLYDGISVNPFFDNVQQHKSFRDVHASASGNGRVNGIAIYHHGIVQNGKLHPKCLFVSECTRLWV